MSCPITRPRHYPRSSCEIRELPPDRQYKYESAVPVRPAFLEDTEVVREPKASKLKQKAFDYISAVPVRPAFDSVPPVPRQTKEVIEAPKKPTYKLDKDTMEKLLGEDVPDPNDVKWLNERARRLAAGETEAQLIAFPPFGRPQKTLKKIQRSLTTSASMSTARTNTELAKIIQEIKDGRAETEVGFAEIIGDLQNIIRSGNANNAQLVAAVKALNLPGAGSTLPFTFYDYKGYKDNQAIIDADLIARQDEPELKLPPQFISLATKLDGKEYAYGVVGEGITLAQMEQELFDNASSRMMSPGTPLPILGIELVSRRLMNLRDVNSVPGATADPSLRRLRPPSPAGTTPPTTPPPSP